MTIIVWMEEVLPWAI